MSLEMLVIRIAFNQLEKNVFLIGNGNVLVSTVIFTSVKCKYNKKWMNVK